VVDVAIPETRSREARRHSVPSKIYACILSGSQWSFTTTTVALEGCLAAKAIGAGSEQKADWNFMAVCNPYRCGHHQPNESLHMPLAAAALAEVLASATPSSTNASMIRPFGGKYFSDRDIPVRRWRSQMTDLDSAMRRTPNTPSTGNRGRYGLRCWSFRLP